MFFKLGLNKEKSLHILPLCRGQTVVTRTRERSRKFPQFQNQRCINSYYVLLPYIISKEQDKMYKGFYFLYRYGDFTLYFFIPLFCRPREKCGTLWKAARLHNVDNIWQKDIKNFFSAVIFFQFLVIKALDPDWIRIRIGSGLVFILKCWIRIRMKWMRIRNPDYNTTALIIMSKILTNK
jgi:hypothetical protein